MARPDPPVVRFLVRPVAYALAWLAMLGALLPYRLHLFRFRTSARLLALVPGTFGMLMRRQFYRHTLAACGPDLTVSWMTVFKTPTARVGRRVFIAPFCWIAEADIRDDAMIGARTAVQGGANQHGFDRLDVPMRDQPGSLRVVTIGSDVWIGTGCTILTDVAPGTIVGAGGVVTRTYPERSILVGVPACPIGVRGEGRPAGDADVL